MALAYPFQILSLLVSFCSYLPLRHIVLFFISEIKAEFVRKVEDIEVKEREVAVLEVEVSSDTAEVTWHKVNSFACFV